MVDGIPNRPLYFYQKDNIGINAKMCWENAIRRKCDSEKWRKIYGERIANVSNDHGDVIHRWLVT